MVEEKIESANCFIIKKPIYCHDCSDLKHEYLVINKDNKLIHQCLTCGRIMMEKVKDDNRF